MCRMTVAMGRFETRALVDGLRLMASNANPACSHEKRSLGSHYRHEDGWGAAWDEGGVLQVLKSDRSCLDDPGLETVARLKTPFLLLHARRASVKGSASIENTHPFRARWQEEDFVFCHNGLADRPEELRPAPGLRPEGTTDSERLFHHILAHLDMSAPRRSTIAALDAVRSYTALLCFLAGSRFLLAVSKRHPKRGLAEYHALWESGGDGHRIVSSEPLAEVGAGDWRKLADGEAVLFDRRGE